MAEEKEKEKRSKRSLPLSYPSSSIVTFE